MNSVKSCVLLDQGIPSWSRSPDPLAHRTRWPVENFPSLSCCTARGVSATFPPRRGSEAGWPRSGWVSLVASNFPSCRSVWGAVQRSDPLLGSAEWKDWPMAEGHVQSQGLGVWLGPTARGKIGSNLRGPEQLKALAPESLPQSPGSEIVEVCHSIFQARGASSCFNWSLTVGSGSGPAIPKQGGLLASVTPMSCCF